MANKTVIVNPKHKKKKKKNKCCGCLMTILITFVVLMVGIFATGWFVGDYFTKLYLDMGLSDVLGVYMDIRTVNKNAVGIKEFTEADADGFEYALKDQLYIKESVEIPYEDIFEAIVGDMLTEEDESATHTNKQLSVQQLRNSFMMDIIIDYGDVDVEDEEETASNPLMQVIMPLLSRENIDLDRLSQHTDSTVKKLTFTDAQLAGFLARMLETGAQKDYGDKQLVSGIANEILFDNVAIASANIKGTESEPVLALTCKLNTASLAKGVGIDYIPSGFGWALDLGAPILLPQETYLTVELALGQNTALSWRVNGLSDEKMARLSKLVRNVSKLAKTEIDIDKILADIAEEHIKPVVDELNSYIEYDKVGESKMSADLFGTAISLAGINKDKAEADWIKSGDMYFTMRALLLSEPEVNEDATFRNQYLTLTGEDAGEVVYLPARFDDDSLYTMVDYQNEFMEELRSKFLLDESVTFSEISTLFGIGENQDGESDSFIDKINFSGDELLQLAKRPDAQNKLVLTDRMIGVLFDEFLDSILGDEDGINDLNPKLSHVTLKKLDEAGAVHNWIEAAFTVDISGALGDDEMIVSLVNALLPDTTVMLSIEIDITPNVAEGYHHAGKINYNNLSSADTDRLLDIIHKFAPDTDFSTAGLLGDIEPQFRDVIADMFDLLPGIELGKSATLDGAAFSGIEAGSVFEIAAKQLSDMASDPSDPDSQLSAEELRSVIVAMWDVEDEQYTARPAHDNYSNFLDEIKDKYYLKDEYTDENSQVKMLETFDDLLYVVDPDNFSDENFVILPDPLRPDKVSLAYDLRDLEELRAFLSDQDFGAIMKNELDARQSEGDSDLDGFTKIESIRMQPIYEWDSVAVVGADEAGGMSPDGKISMILSVNVDRFMSDDESTYLKLLPSTLYFTLEFMISPTKAIGGYDDGDDPSGEPSYHYYDYALKLNEMAYDGDTYNSLMKILRLANDGQNPVEIESVATDVGKALYDQLADLRHNLGDNNLLFHERLKADAQDGDDKEYGFSLGSLYDFLEASDDEGTLDADYLQPAIQGMYQYDVLNPNPNSYRVNGASKGEAVIFSPIDDEEEDPVITVGSYTPEGGYVPPTATFTDTQFGYQLKTDGASIPLTSNPFKSGSGYELKQFDAAPVNSDALLTIAFEVELKDFIGEGASGSRGAGYQNLAPDIMYFSFEVEWVGGSYELVLDVEGNAFVINQMTPEVCVQLFALIGYDTTGLNNQLDDCIEALKELTEVTYDNHNVVITG